MDCLRKWSRGNRGEQRGQFGAEGNHAAHRETTANALGESNDVRGHTAGKILTLEGEPCSGASDAGLHFVDDESALCSSHSLRAAFT